MNLRKEYKFGLPLSGGVLLGVLSGALLFFTLLGTIIGLVWGYSDTMLVKHHQKTAAPKKVKKSSKSSRKTSKSKRKRK